MLDVGRMEENDLENSSVNSLILNLKKLLNDPEVHTCFVDVGDSGAKKGGGHAYGKFRKSAPGPEKIGPGPVFPGPRPVFFRAMARKKLVPGPIRD